VAAQDEAALEAQEQVLADGLDRFEAPPAQLLGQVLDRGLRMRRFHLQLLADERLQTAGRPMNCVSFGHA
jgi:hypothetical protein